MTSPARPPGAPRFVAYSTLTRMPVLAGADAAELLAETREVPTLGFDNRFVEVLDCGEDGPDAGTVALPLEAARPLYRTVFRGHGSLSRPGMPPFPLHDPSPPPPDLAAARSVEEALAALADRARAAGLDGLVAALGRARAEARAEVAARFGEE